MKFGGDKLEGNQSPEDIGMDDDELIDVKIPANLYGKAVDFASKPQAQASSSSGSITASNIPSSSSSSSSSIAPNEKVLLTIHCAENVVNDASNNILAITLFASFTLDHIHNSLLTMQSFKSGISIEYFSDKRPGVLPRDKPLSELGVIVDNGNTKPDITKAATLEARLKLTTAPVIARPVPVPTAPVSETIEIEIVLDNLTRKDNGNTSFKVTVKKEQNFKKMVKLVTNLLSNNLKEKDLDFKFGNKILNNFNKTYRDENIQENSRIVVTRR